MTRSRIHHTIAFFLRRWHRRFGVFASLFVLWLVASGWALNHSEALGLSRMAVHADWLMDWYGLKDGVPETGFFADGYWLIANGESVLLDGRQVPLKLAPPIGMVGIQDLLFIAGDTSVAILTVDRRLVEELRGEALPVQRIIRIGVAGNAVVIEGVAANDAKTRRYSTRDGLRWTAFSGDADWAKASVLPKHVRESAGGVMHASLPLDRVLADLHSGRALGRYGPYFMDFVGALLAALAISGVWMYLRRHTHRN